VTSDEWLYLEETTDSPSEVQLSAELEDIDQERVYCTAGQLSVGTGM